MEILQADTNPLPSWGKFVFGLGRNLAIHRPTTENWHVITFPNIRMVSGLLAAGYASARYESHDFYERESLASLNEGDQITWLTHDYAGLKHGGFHEFVNPESSGLKPEFKYKCSQQGEIRRYADFFDRYRFSRYYGSPFRNTRPLSRNPEFVEAFAPGRIVDLTTQSKHEVCLVGETQLRLDLLSPELSCGGVTGCFDDILRVEDLDDAGESPHHLSLYVNPASRDLEEVSTTLAIYDGARAVRRERSYVQSTTSVVVLDRWDAQARDVITTLKNLRTRTRGTGFEMFSGLQLPTGIEYMAWSRPS